jgi:hypothetical protein
MVGSDPRTVTITFGAMSSFGKDEARSLVAANVFADTRSRPDVKILRQQPLVLGFDQPKGFRPEDFASAFRVSMRARKLDLTEAGSTPTSVRYEVGSMTGRPCDHS